MRKQWLIIAVVFSLLLAACGGDDGNENNAAESSDTDTTSQNQSGEQPFNITITGDYENTIPPGYVQAWAYPEDGYFELFFGQMSHNMQFVLDEDIETGSHELEAEDGINPDQTATVEMEVLVDPEDISAGTDRYDEEVEGTITFDEIGETISGSFEFTAVAIDTDDNDVETRKSVTVTGEFEDITIRSDDG